MEYHEVNVYVQRAVNTEGLSIEKQTRQLWPVDRQRYVTASFIQFRDNVVHARVSCSREEGVGDDDRLRR